MTVRTEPGAREGDADPSPDFSLVLGGPIYQFWLRSRLARPPLDFVKRRIAVITLITWLPLLVLSCFSGTAAGAGIPFLRDIEVHVRFLLALPVLIAAELIVHQRLRPVVEQFVERGIIVPKERPRFNAALESAMRFRNCVVIELCLIALVYTLGHWVWREHIALGRTTWYATVNESGTRLTPTGWWYAFVSIPIFQFILFRWYWRLLIWCRFLWQVSRLNLRLIPTHPDRSGGLAFLGESAFVFAPILFAQGALIAGLFADRVFFEGQNVTAFKTDIFGAVALLVLFILSPLMVFAPLLGRVKRDGLRAYGLLSNRHAQEFDEKWVSASPASQEPLIGSPDISSMADFDTDYKVVHEMRPFPFGLNAVVRLAVVALVPILPLALTVVPLNEVIGRLIKALL